MAFIMVMIASLAAVGLAPGIGSTGGGSRPAPIEESTPLAGETPAGLQSFEGPEKTIDASKSYSALISTDQGDIVVALNAEAPQAANSFAFLAGQNFYDGLQFYWVKPGFTAQTGDPTCDSSGEHSCSGTAGPGYTLPKEGDDTQASKWTVIAPVTSPGSSETHGSLFVISLADGLEFEGTVIGQVVKGNEILQALQERVPCFGAEPSESNPCQTEEELATASPLTIKDVVVQPA